MKKIIFTLLALIFVQFALGQIKDNNSYCVIFIIAHEQRVFIRGNDAGDTYTHIVDTTIYFNDASQEIQFSFKTLDNITEDENWGGDKEYRHKSFALYFAIHVPNDNKNSIVNPSWIIHQIYRKKPGLVDSSSHYFIGGVKNRYNNNVNYSDFFDYGDFGHINFKHHKELEYNHVDGEYIDYEVEEFPLLKCSKKYTLKFVLLEGDFIKIPNEFYTDFEIEEFSQTQYLQALNEQQALEKEMREQEERDRIQKLKSGEILPEINVYLRVVQHFVSNTPTYTNDGYIFKEDDYFLLDERVSLSELPYSNVFEFETKDAIIPADYSTATTTMFRFEYFLGWRDLTIPLVYTFHIESVFRKPFGYVINKNGDKYEGSDSEMLILTDMKFNKQYKLEVNVIKQ